MRTRLFALVFTTLALALPASTEVTKLSTKAAQIKMGMSHSEVVAKLGPADFIVHSSGDGERSQEIRDFAPGVLFDLYWKNGKCGPVVVQFNAQKKATGWNEGRAVCLDKEYPYLPESTYSCSSSNYSAMCSR